MISDATQSVYLRTHQYTCSQTWDIFGHDVDMQDAAFTTINPIAGLVSHLTSALAALNTKFSRLANTAALGVLHMRYCRSVKIQETPENNKHRLCSFSTFIQPTRVGRWIQLDHRPMGHGHGVNRLKAPRCAHHHEARSHFRCLRLDSHHVSETKGSSTKKLLRR